MPDTGSAAEPRPLRPPSSMAAGLFPLPALGPAGRRLAALLLAVLLLLSGAFVIITARDHDAAIEDGWAGAERAALGAAEQVQHGLAAAALIGDRLAEALRRDGPAALGIAAPADVEAMLRHVPQIGGIQLLDATGAVLAEGGRPAGGPPLGPAHPGFRRLSDGAPSMLGTLAWNAAARSWVFGYSRAMRDSEGAFLGMVRAEMLGEELDRFHLGLGLVPGGRIGLFRAEDGAPLMVFPLPAGPLAGPIPAPPAGLMQAMAGQARAGRFSGQRPDGTAVLVAWRLAGEGGAVLATAGVPRAAVLAPYRARLQRNALLFGLALGVVAALGAAVAAALARAARIRGAAEAGRRDLAAMLEATGDGVIALDAAGRVSFVSSRARRMLGADGPLVGLGWRDALPEAAGSPFEAAFRRSMTLRIPAAVEAPFPPGRRRFRAESRPREDGGIVVFSTRATRSARSSRTPPAIPPTTASSR